MEQRPSPIVAGFGGAAVLAAALSFGGRSAQPAAEKQSVTTSSTDKASSAVPAFTADQEGPWYAFCQEYATTEFDHGEDPSHEWGVSGHHVPLEADEGTVEITRSIPIPGSKHFESEKFNVRKHMVGDLAGCVPKGAKLRIVIATVPDPNSTQMPLEFDRDIQAIQAAAAAEHYNYSRFWFPWHTIGLTTDKSADPETEARRRDEPGILCFRKNSRNSEASRERLFVLLVGETPTSGINRLQLSHAFYYREQFAKANQIRDGDDSKLKVAGPHFSASLPAIEDVLDRGLYRAEDPLPKPGTPPLPPIPSANFISPDASGREFIAAFRSFCNTHAPKCTLQTLSLSSEAVRSDAIDYLRSLGYSPRSIALLGEDESAFGGSEQYPLLPTGDSQHVYGLSLLFPRDLSSVRTLSDEESAKLAKSSSKYMELPHGLLPTQLTVKEQIDRDSPAAFGREQEAAQVARSLNDMAHQMRAHRIRAAVIGASNPLDRIYLLEYLHNQLPDLRTATVDSDELELDRPHFVDLTGTVAVTALPSLPGMSNVIPKASPSPPMSFKSSRQLGEFLAIEMLLDPDVDPRAESNQWLAPTGCYQTSVVGEGGFHLISDPRHVNNGGQPTFPCLSMNDETQGLNDAKVPLNSPRLLPAYYMTIPNKRHLPGSFTALLWLLGALNFVHFFSLIQSQRHREGTFSYPHKLKGSLEARRLFLLSVITNQLLLMDLLGLRLCWSVLGSNLSDGRGWLTTIFVLLIMSFTTTTLLLFIFFKRFLTQIDEEGISRSDKGQLVQQMSFASLYVIWTATMICQLPAFQRQSGGLLERIIQLNEGLSPVVPIMAILLGYSLWSWMQLKRLNWMASRKIDLKLQRDMNEYLYTSVQEVMTRTDTLSPNEQIVQLGSLPVALLTGVFLWDGLNGFDGLWFHLWIVVWGFCMLLLTVVTGCFHARSIWNKLEKLLEWLETTTMREAFQQIGSAGLLSIKVWDLAKSERSFTVLSQTVERIGILYGQTSPEASDAKTKLMKIVEADLQGDQVDTGQIDAMHFALNVAVRRAVQVLEVAPNGGTAPPQENELRLYLALRLVAFIRYAILQIGTLITFVAYGYVLAVLSIMFYAFEGRKTLGDLSLLTFAVILIWIATMMMQFQRNGMLSRLEGSNPGEASYFQTAYHLLTVGGLPLLAIVTAQVPAIGNFVLLMFRPLLGGDH